MRSIGAPGPAVGQAVLVTGAAKAAADAAPAEGAGAATEAGAPVGSAGAAVRAALAAVGYNGWLTIEASTLTLAENSRRLDQIIAGK